MGFTGWIVVVILLGRLNYPVDGARHRAVGANHRAGGANHGASGASHGASGAKDQEPSSPIISANQTEEEGQ